MQYCASSKTVCNVAYGGDGFQGTKLRLCPPARSFNVGNRYNPHTVSADRYLIIRALFLIPVPSRKDTRFIMATTTPKRKPLR